MLSAALDSAAILAPAPGSYRYEAFINGKTVGKNRLTLIQTANGIKIDESSTANLETGDSKAATTMLLDPNLNITAYTGTYTALDATMKAVVEFNGREATITAGHDKQTIPLGGSSKGFVILDSALVSGFFMLPAQMRANANGDSTVLVPGTGGSAFIDVIPGDKPARPADVPQRDASLSFAGDGPFVEWYDPQTLIVDEVALPGQNLIIKRKR